MALGPKIKVKKLLPKPYGGFGFHGGVYGYQFELRIDVKGQNALFYSMLYKHCPYTKDKQTPTAWGVVVVQQQLDWFCLRIRSREECKDDLVKGLRKWIDTVEKTAMMFVDNLKVIEDHFLENHS